MLITFGMTYVYNSLGMQIGIAWKEATKVQTELSVICVCSFDVILTLHRH